MKPLTLIILLIPLLLAGPARATDTLHYLNLSRGQLQRIITCNLATGWYCSRLIMQAEPAADRPS